MPKNLLATRYRISKNPRNSLNCPFTLSFQIPICSMHTMLRSEAVKMINSGIAVTVEFVECNRKKGTGGRLRKLVNWCRLSIDVAEKGVVGIYQGKETWARKNDTLDNDIIMMRDPDNNMKHPIPVHYWLLCSINGKRIING